MRHENKDQLEKLRDMLVHVEQKLSPTLPLSVYTSRSGAMTETGKFNGVSLTPGMQKPVFIAPLADDK